MHVGPPVNNNARVVDIESDNSEDAALKHVLKLSEEEYELIQQRRKENEEKKKNEEI